MQSAAYKPLDAYGNTTNAGEVGISLVASAVRQGSRSWWPAEALGVPCGQAEAPAAAIVLQHVSSKGNDTLAELRSEDEDTDLAELTGLLLGDKAPSDIACKQLSVAKDKKGSKFKIASSVCSFPDIVGMRGHTVQGIGHRDPFGSNEYDNLAAASKRTICLDGGKGADAPSVSKHAQDTYANFDSYSGSVMAASFVASQAVASPLENVHAAWALQASCILHVAVFLTKDSRDVLLDMVPPIHPVVFADHMTLAYTSSISQLLHYPVGAEVQLHVIGHASDSRAQAVAVDPPAWLPPTTSACTHVTISLAVGTKAVEAGQLILDAIQFTAVSDPIATEPPAAGSYAHFAEALPLVGRLGVKLAVHGSAMGKECVVYSIEELASIGGISISTDTLESFNRKHAAILGNQSLQTRSSPLSQLSMHLSSPSSSRSTGGSYSPCLSGTMIPLEQLPLPAALDSVCWNGGTAAAAGQWAPATATALCASEAAPAAVGVSAAAGTCAVLQQQLMQCCTSQGVTAVAAADASEAADTIDESASQTNSTGSSGSSDAVQFLSAVKIGDYVAVKPLVCTVGGAKTMQGYISEYAAKEPFQANGVLVVLDDATIGFVTAVLDPMAAVAAAAAGSSSTASNVSSCSKFDRRSGAKAANSHTGRNNSNSNKGKKGSKARKAAAEAAAVARPVTAGGHPAVGLDILSEWALSVKDIAGTTAAAGLSRCNAEEAQRDLQLWNEFDSLQRQHGESLCNVILADCNQDFREAIATIKAQIGGAASSGGTAGNNNDAFAAAGPPAGSNVNDINNSTKSLGASMAAGTIGNTATAQNDDELLQQLALSLGLSPDSAVQLSLLVPHVSAEHITDVLLQHKGNVNKAADTLLAAAASSSQGPISSRNALAHVAQAFAAGNVPAELAHGVQQLCTVYPSLQHDIAEVLLKEHKGDVDEAVRCIYDTQVKEFEARTAIAVGTELAAVGKPTGSLDMQLKQPQHLSEEDQVAVLAAEYGWDLGELNKNDSSAHSQQQRQQRLVPRTPSGNRNNALHGSPPKRTPTAAYAGTSMSRGTTPVAGAAQHRSGPGSPFVAKAKGTAMPRQLQQQQEPVNSPNMEAKRAAKEVADGLYQKHRRLGETAQVFMIAAQQKLKKGDLEEYRKHKAAADKARATAKAAMDQAQKLSWSANNKTLQSWQTDLHWLPVSKALEKFVSQFECLAKMDSPGGILFKVVTGWGKHSEGNEPKIKNGVLKYLEETAERILVESGIPWSVTWEVAPGNDGMINVWIPGTVDDPSSEEERDLC